MVKSELNKRSPLRILEKSIHGGVGKGNIGVIASQKGVGKTACLVHIATDKLFRDKHVIHVSFASRVDHISTWYEDIYKEIAKKRNLEFAVEVHNEIIKNRVIMNFSQEGVRVENVFRSVEAMIKDGHFAADSVIVDGYDIEQATEEDFKAIRDFAGRINLEIWFSVSLKGKGPHFNDQGVPIILEKHLDTFSVIITLQYKGDHVSLKVIKDHGEIEPKDMHLQLDPKTLLIIEEK